MFLNEKPDVIYTESIDMKGTFTIDTYVYEHAIVTYYSVGL